MARINIEECWWTDPRRSRLTKLLGDEALADGTVVRMWRLAQEFWGRGRGLVPREIFETLEAAPKLIQAKLASEQGDQVYVRGSSQWFEWVHEKRAAASAGGKKSAQRPRNAKGQLLKMPKQEPSDSQVNAKRIQVSGSGSGSGSKKKGEAVFFENLSDLLAAIPKDTKENWAKLYAKEFIDRHLIRAWNHYSADHKARPLAAWSRALGGWLERQTKFDERDAKAQRKDMPESGDLGGEYALR